LQRELKLSSGLIRSLTSAAAVDGNPAGSE